MEQYERVAIVSDGDGHDYIIPYDSIDEFHRLVVDYDDNFEEFDGKFGSCAVGGSINYHAELYRRKTI